MDLDRRVSAVVGARLGGGGAVHGTEKKKNHTNVNQNTPSGSPVLTATIPYPLERIGSMQ